MMHVMNLSEPPATAQRLSALSSTAATSMYLVGSSVKSLLVRGRGIEPRSLGSQPSILPDKLAPDVWRIPQESNPHCVLRRHKSCPLNEGRMLAPQVGFEPTAKCFGDTRITNDSAAYVGRYLENRTLLYYLIRVAHSTRLADTDVWSAPSDLNREPCG
jgi:hypothetical protein